ncbi:biotin transporter BioY [Candidatus Nucleicultrix amoebiphila]|jgi:biotin transport system substrate-specific component|uniref:biotin transporter BioY n=1 Tax=Candidatus Nucleicultrix amoebiphila TaxID=1509244 RepID=UPI000A26D108|nr:biotin transporter BioY [Candidatus Nucleicultrix amoebiphila]
MTSLLSLQSPLKSIWWPSKSYKLITEIALIAVGLCLLTLSSKITIPLSPVPITLQTMTIFFIGMTYGMRRSLVTILSFYGLIILGLPVSSGANGLIGLPVFLGPTGGYIVGWAFAMVISGYLVENGWGKNIIGVFLAQLLGSLALYFFGVMQLSFFVGLDKALLTGLTPFLYGDFLKIMTLSLIVPFFWRTK